MPAKQDITKFLLDELEWVAKGQDPKLIQLANEFYEIEQDDPEIFFNQFTLDSKRHTFVDFKNLCQYFSVRQILISIADEIAFVLENKKANSFIDSIRQIKQDNLQNTLQHLKESFSSHVVFTGHPTEFFSDYAIDLSKEIVDLVCDCGRLEAISKKSIHNKLEKLFNCHLTPRNKLSVEDEVLRNLKHFERVYNYLPKIRTDLIEAFSEVFQNDDNNFIETEIDKILAYSMEFRSWTGGDADGNFRVVADKMANVVNLHKHAASRLHLSYLDKIHSKTDSNTLLKEIENHIKDLDIEQAIAKLSTLELDAHDIGSFILLLRIFGKNIACIDVRQNMYLHSKVTADILKGIEEYLSQKANLEQEETSILKFLKRSNYSGIIPTSGSKLNHTQSAEDKRTSILNNIFENKKIIEIASYLLVSGWFKARYDTVHEELARIQIMTVFPKIFRNYIVSNSEGASSILQVKFLAKICSAKFNIIPLFESKSGLENSVDILRELLSNQLYKTFLNNAPQKVMIGYSDSQKENGICILPTIQKTINNLKQLSKELQTEIKFFHGNGLDIGRGGPQVIESEQTFQGRHIRYTFMNYEDMRHYYSTLISKPNTSEEIEFSHEMQIGFEEFSSLTNNRILRSHLEKYLEFATPFQLFVKTNNFSSRATKRTADDGHQSPYAKWFSELVSDSAEVLNGIRAIPWVNTIEGTNTYFNLWLGLDTGINNIASIASFDQAMAQSRSLKDAIEKSLIAINYTDLDLAWKFLPHDQRPNSSDALKKKASKINSPINHSTTPACFLAMLEIRMQDFVAMCSEHNLTLSDELASEIKFRKNNSIFIRATIAWLNRHLIYNHSPAKALFYDAKEADLQKISGALYLAFNEYRTMPKTYLNSN